MQHKSLDTTVDSKKILEKLNVWKKIGLPAALGIELVEAKEGYVSLQLQVRPQHMASNGYLHAGTIVTIADSACGWGCNATLPEGAIGFTTIELKSNFLGTAREGLIRCIATRLHGGRTTHVWDAHVTGPDGKTIAIFRCTQFILYPKL